MVAENERLKPIRTAAFRFGEREISTRKGRSPGVGHCYFFTILPILLLYGVGLTNTPENFMVHQLGMTPLPRAILSFVLTAGLIGIVASSEQLVVRVMGWLVYPFIAVLIGLGLFLVPEWNGAALQGIPSTCQFSVTLWLSIPVLVFSFNHPPVISRFAVAQHEHMVKTL